MLRPIVYVACVWGSVQSLSEHSAGSSIPLSSATAPVLKGAYLLSSCQACRDISAQQLKLLITSTGPGKAQEKQPNPLHGGCSRRCRTSSRSRSSMWSQISCPLTTAQPTWSSLGDAKGIETPKWWFYEKKFKVWPLLVFLRNQAFLPFFLSNLITGHQVLSADTPLPTPRRALTWTSGNL